MNNEEIMTGEELEIIIKDGTKEAMNELNGFKLSRNE